MSITRTPGSATGRSPAVRHDEIVYAVATAASDSASVAEQTRLALAALDRNLDAVGSDKTRLLQATVYLRDMAAKAEMDAVWCDWIGGAETWPQRAGDRRVAEDLAAALPDVTWLRSGLHFDGGDFVADERAVFATPAVARRNIQHTVENRKELLDLLREQLGRRVILLADAPNHHAGMFMMPVGHNTILVGDPRLAREAMGDQPLGEDVMPPGLDLSDATRQNFDAVARRCEAAGYRVVRIPVVPGLDGRTYLTYLNVILDERDEARIVYMPVYHHVAALNAAAGEVWRQLGYLVRPVDCSTAYKHGGSLRCLVNVVSRG